MAMNRFYYDQQLKSYMLQGIAVFDGLQVQTGIGECGESEMISVPIVVGNKDRVVAAIHSGNTQNRVFSLPTMAMHMTGLTQAPERRRTPGMLDQRVTLPTGGIYPQDLTVVKRAMPVPYDMELEVSIYASNTQQMHQILEQILVVFNPDIQIQKSDGPFDWTRITTMTLTNIANEENYPVGSDRRLIVWTLTFNMPIYLSVPLAVKDDLVRKVIIQLGDLNSMHVNEVDEDGELIPFGTPLSQIILNAEPAPDAEHTTFVQPDAPDSPRTGDTWLPTA